MAPLEPDTNIIAVELYRPGLAKLLGASVRGGVDNIRMIKGDGVEVLNRMFPEASLDGVRIFSPILGRKPGTTSGASSSQAPCTSLPPA